MIVKHLWLQKRGTTKTCDSKKGRTSPSAPSKSASELTFSPAKNIIEETIAESFYNIFGKNDQNTVTKTLKEKVTNQTLEM